MRKSIKVLSIISIVVFVCLSIFLIYEASMPGEVSSSHSGAVSGAIQDVTEKVESTVGGSGEVSESITNNWSTFTHYVRKGIGHFGAFLVLASFGTFGIVMLLKDKASGVLVSLVLGVSIATITELIQLHVPGRYGCYDDIILDSTGYLVGFALTLVVLGIAYLIKRGKVKGDGHNS